MNKGRVRTDQVRIQGLVQITVGCGQIQDFKSIFLRGGVQFLGKHFPANYGSGGGGNGPIAPTPLNASLEMVIFFNSEKQIDIERRETREDIARRHSGF